MEWKHELKQRERAQGIPEPTVSIGSVSAFGTFASSTYITLKRERKHKAETINYKSSKGAVILSFMLLFPFHASVPSL